MCRANLHFIFRQRDLNNIASQKCRAKKKAELLNEEKECEFQVLHIILWVVGDSNTKFITGPKKQRIDLPGKVSKREGGKTEKNPEKKWLLSP